MASLNDPRIKDSLDIKRSASEDTRTNAKSEQYCSYEELKKILKTDPDRIIIVYDAVALKNSEEGNFDSGEGFLTNDCIKYFREIV